MRRTFSVVLVAVALFGGYQIAARANGTAIPSAPSSSGGGGGVAMKTPEEMAVEVYNSGISHRDRANKSETQARNDKKDGDRVKNEKKARDEYEKALKDFTKAAQLNPSLAQAYNGMGFSQRKLGDYAKALENYDKALQLSPKFPDAIEYRGEAYLALNRVDDAKQAYLTLFGMDRKQADSLMAAMKEYVAKKKADPTGIDAAALTALEGWINERAGLAEQTKIMALNHRGSWER